MALFCHNKDAASIEKVPFSYSLLSSDTLDCEYLNLSTSKVKLSTEINIGNSQKITLQKFELDSESRFFFHKHNFSGVDKVSKYRDAVELYGKKLKIDSLIYGKDYMKNPYIFASLINVAKFSFKKSDYIAFFIQDISNPITSPNTLLLLFDVTNKNKILYIPIGFQASEDLKCINDFNKDGVLDFAKWSQGYDFQKHLYRYELSSNHKLTLKKEDYIAIIEETDGYFVDVENSNWRYSKIAQ